jgi:hypothetical protein
MPYVQVERPTVEHARGELLKKYPTARVVYSEAAPNWQGWGHYDVAVLGTMILDDVVYAWRLCRSVDHWNLNRIYTTYIGKTDKFETLG